MAETKSLTLAEQVSRPAMIKKFAKALGSEGKALQFLSSITSAVSLNSQLSKANPMSVLGAGMVAASLNLDINPSLGFAAIIPYKNNRTGDVTAQFQIMTNGYIQLFQRSGLGAKLNPFIVYADDFIGFDRITGDLHLKGQHDINCTEVVGYGCFMRLKNGFEHTEFWTKDECIRHGRRYSKSFSSGPWADNFDAMALKTVTKALLKKYGPMSTQMITAVNSDSAEIIEMDDGEIVFNYVDNPEADVQFDAEQQKEREELLAKLNQKGITEKLLVSHFGNAKTIDDVPTQAIRDLVAQEC